MKHSILCVDDEVDNVEALERLFRRKFQVLKATSGEEALAILAENPVAVIISDQRMPQMSGVEFLAASIKTHPKSIRILLTGYTDIDSVIAAINSGHVYRYVTKPWDPVDLTNAVDKAVERYELGEELIYKNRALEAALDELKTLDQAKNQFMILVNHELKTPLTSMLSFTDLLSETKLDAEQDKYLARIKTAAARLQEMINDSLEFVLAETGQMRIDLKPIRSVQLFTVATLGDAINELASSRKLKLDFQIENKILTVDEKAVRNVIRRIAHNAVKFAEVGTTVEFVGKSSIRSGKSVYEFSITNLGKPVQAARLEQMLKPFTLNENVMNHSVGTGLGLSISQAFLKLHNSELRFECSGNQVRATMAFEIRK